MYGRFLHLVDEYADEGGVNMGYFKKLFCRHHFVFVANIYGDATIPCDWKRSILLCDKCGKVKFNYERMTDK